jgi:hypothetical protein
LAEGRGRVLVVACGAARSVMGLLPYEWGAEPQDLGPFPLLARPWPGSAAVPRVCTKNLHLNLKTSNIFL